MIKIDTPQKMLNFLAYDLKLCKKCLRKALSNNDMEDVKHFSKQIKDITAEMNEIIKDNKGNKNGKL